MFQMSWSELIPKMFSENILYHEMQLKLKSSELVIKLFYKECVQYLLFVFLCKVVVDC